MTYKKFGFLAAILALSGFYLYTLYLAAHPNVSLAYKLYYTEGKTRFWEHNSSMTYQPGNELNLTKPSRFLSSEGWAKKPSEQGTELSGQGGLYFVLPKQQAQPEQLTIQARSTAPRLVPCSRWRWVMISPPRSSWPRRASTRSASACRATP